MGREGRGAEGREGEGRGGEQRGGKGRGGEGRGGARTISHAKSQQGQKAMGFLLIVLRCDTLFSCQECCTCSYNVMYACVLYIFIIEGLTWS